MNALIILFSVVKKIPNTFLRFQVLPLPVQTTLDKVILKLRWQRVRLD